MLMLKKRIMKKRYIKPTMRIVHMRVTQILCGSTGYRFNRILEGPTSEEDEEEEEEGVWVD